jgi:hypothetical protein
VVLGVNGESVVGRLVYVEQCIEFVLRRGQMVTDRGRLCK